MPSWTVRKTKSFPLLQRKLPFVHLAPIPEVPIMLPENPRLTEIDLLLGLLDDILDGADKLTILKQEDFRHGSSQ